MEKNQIKLLHELASQIKSQREQSVKPSKSLHSAKILNENGTFATAYKKLDKVFQSVK